jgi:hypothetical protein
MAGPWLLATLGILRQCLGKRGHERLLRRVTLNQDRDKVADSPRFEGENGPDRQYQITIYRYYGYA